MIVLDPDDRVLLFRYDDPPPAGTHWTTPGGGLERSETFEAGARRELAEETGWTGLPLTGPVCRCTRRIYGARYPRFQRDVYFWTRTATRELGDVAAMHEHDGIADVRWWTLGELDGTTATVYPPRLSALVRGMICLA